MDPRTRDCPQQVRRGRLRTATEFFHAASVIEDEMTDAFVNLCVLAGIAASDVSCCARLGMYAIGENHNDAVALLGRADRAMEQHLRSLLNLKSKIASTHIAATANEQKRAKRAAETLMQAARRTSMTGGDSNITRLES